MQWLSMGGDMAECALGIYMYLHVSVFVGDCVWVYGVNQGGVTGCVNHGRGCNYIRMSISWMHL